MENLPKYIYSNVIFIVTTFITIWLFYKPTNKSKISITIIIIWLILQGVLSFSGFYVRLSTIPPRFPLLILPPLLLIISLFTTAKGKKFIDSLDQKSMTLLHTVRIPVEIVLLLLYLDGFVPKLMTYEGRNFDIISGLTAPLIVYYGYAKIKLSRTILLFWNFLCLGLLLNIVVNAILSAPFQFQQFAFDQPNIAVLYFPFVWLPCCIVPIVLFSHLATIRQLLIKYKG